MPFKFRMNVLLKIRKEEERQAQIRLGELRKIENEIVVRINTAVLGRTEWSRNYNDEARKAAPERELMLIEKYLIALEGHQRLAETELRELSKEVKVAVANVEKAYKGKKQMEYLRDKQKKDYDDSMELRIKKETEEINLVRFVLKHFNTKEEAHL